MTNDKTEAAEMEKLIRDAPKWKYGEIPNLDHDEAYDFMKYDWPKIRRYIKTLQSRNKVLEEDWKRMRTVLEFIANTYHEQSSYLDSNGQVMEAQIAKNVLSSLHHSPESV